MKRFLVSFVAAAALLTAFTAPAADLQGTATYVNAISNAVTLNAVANAYTNLNDIVPRPIAVPKSGGLAIGGVFVGSSTLVTTNAIGIGWALSVDGTNYCNATNQFLWSLIYPKGTTTAYSYTAFTESQLQGAIYIKPVQVTNNTFATTNMTGTLSALWVGRP